MRQPKPWDQLRQAQQHRSEKRTQRSAARMPLRGATAAVEAPLDPDKSHTRLAYKGAASITEPWPYQGGAQRALPCEDGQTHEYRNGICLACGAPR